LIRAKDLPISEGKCPVGFSDHSPLPALEPRFKKLTIALVPQPREVPPPPFDKEELQRTFSDVLRHYTYQSFEFTAGERGAAFANGPEDTVELRPALFQFQAKMDGPDVLTGGAAKDKAHKIFKIGGERLQVTSFLRCQLQIVATVDAPGENAIEFVGEHLLRDGEQAKVLGSNYFGGGVKFRSILPSGEGEDFLSVEPYVQDNSLVWLETFVGRQALTGPIDLDAVSTWTEESFEFLEGPVMGLLSG
jgi:hypothetical protein